MSDLPTIVEKLRAVKWRLGGQCCGETDSEGACAAPACTFGDFCRDAWAAADLIARLTAERDEAREALNGINALDPESNARACSYDALVGLVNMMGERARAALRTGEGSGE